MRRPNPRLQRTPLRAPLSRKPLGDREKLRLCGNLLSCLGVGLVMAIAGLGCSSAQAARNAAPIPSITTYQVTGTVVAITEDRIVVDKGGMQWEIARDATFKVTGDLRMGSKVTIWYRLAGISAQVLTEVR